MASEAVKKVLEAESESERKTAEAKQRRDEILMQAEGRSAHIIQKRLGDASKESAKIRNEFDCKLEDYKKNADAECEKQLGSIKALAEKNMNSAVEAVIREYF